MRIGYNETKDAPGTITLRRHRIIMPVYVPNLEGYYAQQPEIVGMALESLRLTTAGRARITLVANACCGEMLDRLRAHHDRGDVDQLVVNEENWGRIDGVLSAARGSYEGLLTLSDSDVLFKPGWLDVVERLFTTFPESASVSVVPHPAMGWHHTSATILGALVRGELSVDKVVSDDDIDAFARSINNAAWIKPHQRAHQVVVRRSGVEACAGSGHFLITVRRELLGCLPKEPSLKPLGGGSDEKWYDQPFDEHGYWRLASPRAFAYHMGNVVEPWMREELRQMQETPVVPAAIGPAIPAPRRPLTSVIPWRARRAFVRGLCKLGLDDALKRRTAALSMRESVG